MPNDLSNLTEDDLDQITRTVLGESSSHPVEQSAVAATILNRLQLGSQGGYADTVRGVVHAPYQFEAWSHPGAPNYPARFDPSSPQYKTARAIVQGIASGQLDDPTGGKTNFLEPGVVAQRVRGGQMGWPGWARQGGQKIGQQVFYPNPKGENAPEIPYHPGGMQMAEQNGVDDIFGQYGDPADRATSQPSELGAGGRPVAQVGKQPLNDIFSQYEDGAAGKVASKDDEVLAQEMTPNERVLKTFEPEGERPLPRTYGEQKFANLMSNPDTAILLTTLLGGGLGASLAGVGGIAGGAEAVGGASLSALKNAPSTFMKMLKAGLVAGASGYGLSKGLDMAGVPESWQHSLLEALKAAKSGGQ